ncbi:MAG: hypothetical protein R3C26_20525 [Calditrichia bacterium]
MSVKLANAGKPIAESVSPSSSGSVAETGIARLPPSFTALLAIAAISARGSHCHAQRKTDRIGERGAAVICRKNLMLKFPALPNPGENCRLPVPPPLSEKLPKVGIPCAENDIALPSDPLPIPHIQHSALFHRLISDGA